MNGFELSLARRLAWKAEGRRRVSPAVGVAVTGVALSMVVMLLSVAVMLGFKREVSARVMALDDAITISAYNSENQLSTFPPAEVLAAISLPPQARAVGRTSAFSILKTPDDFLGVSLRAESTRPLADSTLWLSSSMAAKLRLEKGARVPAYFFTENRLRARVLTVDSIYSTGFQEHDDVIAYCAPALIEQMENLPAGAIHQLGIYGLNPDEVEPLADKIHSELLSAYYSGNLTKAYGLSTIFQTDAGFFSWLALLDTNVIVILALMGGIAAFTLISSLFIIILERVRTIGLLKALGAANGQIRRIFMLMAERLVLRGLLWGNIIGLAIIAIQNYTHILPLDPQSYYVDFVPVQFSWLALILLNAAALLLSWLVLLLPAMIVARISPATTMRYE